jgi:antitoxin (DNA-binding transcriptional repressor) of toxin-antitoxin stability system
MYHMKRATVRDLRYAFPKVEATLAEGEEIEIVKRGKVVATLVPVARERPKTGPLTADFMMARLKSIYGDRMSPVTGAETIRQDRDRD